VLVHIILALLFGAQKRHNFCGVKRSWETIADHLGQAGWNCGSISSTDHEGRQFWVVAAEREDAGRFVVHADEKLTAFVELESVIREAK
jgi:hypothetical protein